jgi:pantoate kinase
MASFNVDDIVQLTPKDKIHPALLDGSNGFGIVLDTNVNGNANFYRVAVGNIRGTVYLMEAADLTAYTGPIASKVVASLPPPTGKGKH